VLRRAPLLVSLVAALVWIGGSQAAVSQTIYAWFDVDGNLNVRYVDNSNVGSTVPPGTYQVILNNNTADDYAVDHKFHIFGPGVDYSTPAGAVQTSFTVTFQAGATYTVQDDLDPADHHQSFLASNSAGSPAPSGGTTTPAPAPAPTGKKPTSSDIVGSAVAPFRGTLSGAVSSAGKLTLSYKGKGVATLKAGKYTVAVVDRTSRLGFDLQRIRAVPIAVTSPSFVGKRTASVVLKAGQWWFFSPAGKKSYFIVVA
jgi:hypothetical protein